ncbi:MAG: FkbM family methyltransferase [Betaproteobacteria bacterium]|nr:FkbM family methyltransferase [Betaproteobacteria bacterium]
MPNSIAALPGFSQTRIHQAFRSEPLGFADVGSLGGVHPVVLPIATCVHALCFEPDPEGCAELREKYAQPAPFAQVTVQQVALGAHEQASVPLYVSSTPTNTSLLPPNPLFIERYHADKFKLSHVSAVRTCTLDSVIAAGSGGPHAGEFLKLDTQGTEFEILQGARQTLTDRTVAVLCEVEFFQVYEGQRTLADIVCLLREFGLVLYALYPHYRSAGNLDRRHHSTEERLMWADAVFFKDPFDDINRSRRMATRQARALILAAIALRFYDFALEVVAAYEDEPREREALGEVVRVLAAGGRDRLLEEFKSIGQGEGDDHYLRVCRFVEANRYNNSTEHLWTSLAPRGKS